MIVDGHNYCVPQIDAPQGYPTLAAKMRAVQAELGGHHQPVWRVRDRAPSDNSTLIDPATGELRDVEWTRDLGRLAWRVDGETYTKQYLPSHAGQPGVPPGGPDTGDGLRRGGRRPAAHLPAPRKPRISQQLPRRRDEPVSRPPLQARHADRGRDTGRPGRRDRGSAGRGRPRRAYPACSTYPVSTSSLSEAKRPAGTPGTATP